MKSKDSIIPTENSEANAQAQSSTASFEADVQHSFFYTDSKFIEQLDNTDIMAAILKRYPFLGQEQTDSVIKKNLILFLNDDKFVEYIIDYYNISIYDLFKLLYGQFGSIFKGPFLKKVKNTIDGKKYAAATRRKHEY